MIDWSKIAKEVLGSPSDIVGKKVTKKSPIKPPKVTKEETDIHLSPTDKLKLFLTKGK